MLSFRDLFQWERFVTPSVIKVFFWLAVAIIVLFALRRRAPVRTVVVEQPRTVEQPRAESTYPVVPPRPIVRENLAE